MGIIPTQMARENGYTHMNMVIVSLLFVYEAIFIRSPSAPGWERYWHT
jgi:hypothetical protein